MIGYLFDDKKSCVELENTSFLIGGAWHNSEELAVNSDSIKFIYRKLESIPNAVFFDIGANTGSFSLLPILDRKIKVFSFEPNYTAYRALIKNVALNGLVGLVCAYNYGLSNTDGEMTLQIPFFKKGMQSGLATYTKGFWIENSEIQWIKEQQVQVMTLDGFVKKFKKAVLKIDLIRVDTEGWEKAIIEGGLKTIEQFRPRILIRHNVEKGSYKLTELLDLVKVLEYSVETISPTDVFCYPDIY